MTGSRVDPGLHPELDLADGAHRLARVLDEPLHLRGRAAGSLGVRVAREEHQERVAPELEDVAAAAVRDADQAFEDAADREDQLLGACTTPRLEPLGEGGEAGQVDRDERAVELVPLLGRRTRRPVENEPWQVRLEGCVPLCVHPRPSVRLRSRGAEIPPKIPPQAFKKTSKATNVWPGPSKEAERCGSGSASIGDF